jgi:hypothetical protein
VKAGLLGLLMLDAIQGPTLEGEDTLTLPPPKGPGRKPGPGELVCSCCGEHAADCRQASRQGTLEPTCNLCAAPGLERHPLE